MMILLNQVDAGVTCFPDPRWRPDGERSARHLTRLLALALQAAALRRYVPAWWFKGFCAQRLDGDRGRLVYGDVAGSVAIEEIIGRVLSFNR